MRMERAFFLIAVLVSTLSVTDGYAAVGRTAGKYGTTQTGAASYTIPIWSPPGPRGLQPHIALIYNSQSGNGPEGVGWSLTGLSSIYRCRSTYAQDAAPAPVTLAYTDRFCLDGKRLRLTSSESLSTYGQSGTTYQTEIADFSNITAEGTTGQGPTYFTVHRKDGLIYEYGNGGNSQVLLNGTASAWYLDKVTDRAGNTMTIAYEAPSTNLAGATLPATISWVPSAHGSTTYVDTMQFKYSPLTAPIKVGYVAGSSYVNSMSLTNIEIEISGSVVKNYVLGYAASATTGRQTLMSVKECADSGATDCLAPTSITYQAGTAGTASPVTSTASGATNGTVYSVDIDGDGLQDLVFATTSGKNYEWWVQFATATGYKAPINTGAVSPIPAVTEGQVVQTDFLIDNFDGTNANEILAAVGSTWYVYKWNGSAFTATSTGVAVVAGKQYLSADVNGDGRPDLIYLTGPYTYTLAVQLNTSTATTTSFVATPVMVTIQTLGLSDPIQIYGDNQLPNSSVKHYDFDGDGRQDLILMGYADIGFGAQPLLSRFPTSFVAANYGTFETISGPYNIEPVHWNDDGCTDLIVGTELLLSACNGASASAIFFPVAASIALDWDGDGRTDALANVSGTWQVYRSEGTTFAAGVSTGIAVGSGTYIVTDKNGDGLDDLVFANAGASNALYYGLHNGAGKPPDLATAFVDGYGNSASPTYVSIAENNYSQYTDATYPYLNYIGPLYVANETVFSDPSTLAGTYDLTYWYYGAWSNLQGRGFQAFYAMRTYDSRNALYDYQYFERAFPYSGMKFQDIVSNGTFYPSQSVGTPGTTNLDTTADNERVFPYFSNWTSYRWEVGGTENADLITTTSTNYNYDDYGNATTVATTVTDNDPGSPYSGQSWTKATANTTDISTNSPADLTAWCLNQLDETQITYSSTLSGSTAVTRTRTFTPDTPSLCRTKTIVTEPTANSGTYKVTEALSFDNFGNVASDTLTGATMPSSPASREVQMNWGTTGQFMKSYTDPLNETANWTYASSQALTFGVPDSVKDANGLTTSWGYDAFGRKTSEVRPDDTSTTWSWSLCSANCEWSNSEYGIVQTQYQTNGSTAIRADTTLYDPVDRATQVAGPTVMGTTAIVQSLYDSIGRLHQQSMPFLSGGTTYQTTYAYDVLNRLVSASRPISASNSSAQSTTYAYAGRKTTTFDPYDHANATISDVNGWLRQSIDALGYTVVRSYDSAGSVIGITDSVGNSLLSNVSYAYGLKPLLLGATDADRGAWTYTIDSLGERTAWKDAKKNSFSMTYDGLSRPLTRTEPDLYSEWVYGSAAPNVGKITSECTQSDPQATPCTSSPWLYNEVRSYDTLSRLSTRAITESGNSGGLDGNAAYKYTYSYALTTGYLSAITYPKSSSTYALNLDYGYQYGLLSSITDTTDTAAFCGTTCVLWTADATNARGELTQETLGNNVVTNRTFDAVTSWLTAATAGVAKGAALLNQSYLEDENGNVTQRQNNNLGLTESFAYDADNRLTCAELSSSCSAQTFIYDSDAAGPGNITTQAGVGTYTYPKPGQPQPHAVTAITGTFNGVTNPKFAYDANGNMTSRASSSANISWFDSNYPETISAVDATGSEEVSFMYGPDRQRWKQIYTGPGTTETTYYVSKELEVVFNGSTTNYRHYVFAAGKPVVVYSRTSAGTDTMSYFLQDHQGGVAAIVSNSGAVDVDESFSAFGARRNPETWSGRPTAADLSTIAGLSRQGFTFQTWLGQSMGLNHMNGRVEDAFLARFLSPDPRLPDPTNAQSYNRYGYAHNNPLTRVDPDGFDDVFGNPPASGPGCGCWAQVGANSYVYNALQNQVVVTLNGGGAVPPGSDSLSATMSNITSGTNFDGSGKAPVAVFITYPDSPQTNQPNGAQNSPTQNAPMVVTLVTEQQAQFATDLQATISAATQAAIAQGNQLNQDALNQLVNSMQSSINNSAQAAASGGNDPNSPPSSTPPSNPPPAPPETPPPAPPETPAPTPPAPQPPNPSPNPPPDNPPPDNPPPDNPPPDNPPPDNPPPDNPPPGDGGGGGGGSDPVQPD